MEKYGIFKVKFIDNWKGLPYNNVVENISKGGKFMDAFADTLGRVGAWFGQNKYLSAIKNAFQNFRCQVDCAFW